MAKPTRTTNRLHLTDLSPTRFEDLAMQLVYRLHRWEEIHHDGRTGSDDGVDIRAIERLEDESLRHWYVQCRRYATAAAATLKKAVDDALAKTKTAPDVLLIIVACDVSLDARTEYEKYARASGIETPMIWPASTLETKLYSDHPDLLFAFFGVSLARQERSRETNLKRTLGMKRRLSRIFKPSDRGRDFIVHSVDDETYPEAGSAPRGQMSGWFKPEFCGFYYNGIEVYLRVEGVVIERSTGRWALIDYDLSKKVDQERFVTANVFRVGRIPFRNIVECDEEGDEYYPGPHLYCKYAENGEPYESMIFKLTDEATKLANLWPGYTLEAGQQQPSVMKKLPKGMRKPEAPESA